MKKSFDVISSAAEDKLRRKFNNRKAATDMEQDLITSDQKQPVTPLKMDNYTLEGFVNLGMKQKKRSKTWDMKWHWLRDREVLEQLRLYWYRGTKK